MISIFTVSVMLGGCSSASKSSDEPEQTVTPATEVTVGKFTCQSEISIQEGSSTAYEKYCKISTGEKFSVTPEKVDTKKAGSSTVALTLTDESGNITMTKVKVTVTPKPTPTPEPVEEPTPEPEQNNTQSSSSSSSSNRPSTQSRPSNQTVTPSQPSNPAPAAPAAPAQPAAPAAPNYEVDDEGTKAGTAGSPEGSTFDDQGSCMASGGTKNHTCTWDPASSKYVLTYQ